MIRRIVLSFIMLSLCLPSLHCAAANLTVGVVDHRLVSQDDWIAPNRDDWQSQKIVDIFKANGIAAEVIGADSLKDLARLQSYKAIMIPTDHSYPDEGSKNGTVSKNLVEYVKGGGIYIMSMAASHFRYRDINDLGIYTAYGASEPDFFGFNWQTVENGASMSTLSITPAAQKIGIPTPVFPDKINTYSRAFGKADIIFATNQANQPSLYAVSVGKGVVVHFAGGAPYTPALRDWLVAAYSAIAKSDVLSSLLFDQARAARVYAFDPVAQRPNSQLSLDGEWELAQSDNSSTISITDLDQLDWIKVKMPNPIQYALMEAGKVKNLWYSLNYKDLQWIAQKDWYLRKSFTVPSNWKGKTIRLRFDGMDYIGCVWLDGKCLGTHEGMYGGPTFDVSVDAAPGKQHELLVLLFHEDIIDYTYRGSVHNGRPATVKSDAIDGLSYIWGNRYRSMGLWQPVRFVASGKAYIESPYVRTDSIAGGKAQLWAQAKISNINSSFDGVIDAQILDPSGSVVWQKTIRQTVPNGNSYWERPIKLNSPKLWWPNGMGDHPLYKLRLTISDGKQKLDEITSRFGVRTLELQRNPSSPKAPRAYPFNNSGAPWDYEALLATDESYKFMFVVNGIPFYAKGVSWMTSDDVCKLDPRREEWMIRTAKLAGHNLFRLNAGVCLFETERFYNMCDESGILVWQELPLNWCGESLAPTGVWRDQLMQSVLMERQHPSLAVYVGGNEFNPYGEAMQKTTNLGREILSAYTDRPYRMSSPGGGTYHAYGPWSIWSGDPNWYLKLYGEGFQFVSEWSYCTYQGMSFYEKIAPKEELDSQPVGYDIKKFLASHPTILDRFGQLYDIDILMHNKASWYGDLAKTDFCQYTEFCQMVHADIYGYVFEHWRAQFPYKGGQTVWMYNPLGPTAGWNVIDWFGQPIISYYSTLRANEPVHVLANVDTFCYAPGDKFRASVFALNDHKQPIKNAAVTAKFYDRMLKPIKTEKWNLTVPAGGYKSDARNVTWSIPNDLPESYFFLELTLSDSKGKQLSQQAYWLRVVKSLLDPQKKKEWQAGPLHDTMTTTGPWMKPQIEAASTSLVSKITSCSTSLVEAQLTVVVKNTGKTPAYPVRLIVAPESYSTFWTDNYFWLAPGQSKTVTGTVRLDMAGLDPVTNPKRANLSDLTLKVDSWNAPLQKLQPKLTK